MASSAPFDAGAHLAQQRELFELCFPENKGTPIVSMAHYQWKFRQFPSKPSAYEYERFEDSRMVSYYAAIPYPYEISGKRRTAGMVCDVMTHPDMRGKGLFTEIGRVATDHLAQSGIDFTTGYPIRPEVIPGHIKIGWKIVFDLPLYISFLRTNSVLTPRKLGWAAPIGNAAVTMYHLARSLGANRIAGHETRVLNKADFLALSEYDAFFESWKSSVRNPLLKSKTFIDWRTSAPGTEYFFVTARRNSQLTALAIVRATKLQGIPCLAILDFMVTDRASLPAMHIALRRLAAEQNCEAICTMMAPGWARTYRLSRFGFLRSPFKFSLIIKKLNAQIPDDALFGEANWHLMWIDSDDL